jgi:hypothetical protein
MDLPTADSTPKSHIENAFLAIGILMLLSIQVSARESNIQLAEDQAIILVRFTMHPATQISGTHLTLGLVGSDFKTNIEADESVQYFVVPAGHYYVVRTVTGFSNVMSKDAPEPEDLDMTIFVPNQTVVYMGDYKLDRYFDLSVAYRIESLEEAKNMTALTRYPLRMSKENNTFVNLSWE